MATRAHTTIQAPSRRRRPASPATFSPLPGETLRRRMPRPAAIAPAVTPLLPADRARIEALLFRLIDWLDAQDAPLVDMEPDHDGEDTCDNELSEPTESLVHLCDRLGVYGRTVQHRGSIS
ncbi:hypothetical protein [Roseomonas haemaphysalidis]|uniref:Uncharacterized protein n=1 Tax=Roseomonas haemaphysalidis TaxID=2768162 RepID=A0ABS3KY69_9PROT|nr:hypothetical protein [Roseomonas haemaphysalidis]MBO1081842.1 hypothetical protein [Roseomonas haemaphysalidis]